eukprot:SAG22_NODE_4042_length_1411_cov_27.146341_1_plen_56_part_10
MLQSSSSPSQAVEHSSFPESKQRSLLVHNINLPFSRDMRILIYADITAVKCFASVS